MFTVWFEYILLYILYAVGLNTSAHPTSIYS